MKTLYFTFGQSHIHRINGQIFDKDTVCAISALTEATARQIMFDTFGVKWSMEYFEPPIMALFPGGIIELDKKDETPLIEAREPDPRRIQCEAVALKIYEQLDKINLEASYAGQVQQCEEAVTGEWCIRVADIIQKELEWK